MFSKELAELDKNTVQYMIDEMQDTIDAQNNELTSRALTIDSQTKTINKLQSTIEEQKELLLSLQKELDNLKHIK